ncbi:hypothetical protein [Clostridium sporogenes]|uniref:hypothetical protein n=1 Tax=Clostridium sporogenes TaxID=1509 RepID=UPI00024BA634|nr:hypothetical protein [Clostridium sporogenes]EHN17054.1 hypothetical protein IYC_00712 [Clostridium sporogenes PA 3679]NFQ35234.1 hypothetical protein [Clostridium sporogenes]NFQ60604.1 hypothetical protein [Clostridium sporogenes]NFU11165.1 hypothetical protein [Clostridium sporogenes]NFU43885.1 hypothetical protein [Clostridium sporogenes]
MFESDKSKNEQLSFLTNTKETITTKNDYDLTICNKCLCDRCKYSVEIYPFLDSEECKEVNGKSCFNCDECYYYGMDDKSLSRDKVKFKCNKFKMSNYYLELQAKIRRKSFKII